MNFGYQRMLALSLIALIKTLVSTPVLSHALYQYSCTATIKETTLDVYHLFMQPTRNSEHKPFHIYAGDIYHIDSIHGDLVGLVIPHQNTVGYIDSKYIEQRCASVSSIPHVHHN